MCGVWWGCLPVDTVRYSMTEVAISHLHKKAYTVVGQGQADTDRACGAWRRNAAYLVYQAW
jgi:hypothetical protein